MIKFAFLVYYIASAGTNGNLRSSNERQSRVLTTWTNPNNGQVEELPNCFTTYRNPSHTDDQHDDGAMFAYCNAFPNDDDKCCFTQGSVSSSACGNWADSGKVTVCKGGCRGGQSCDGFGAGDYTIGQKACDGHQSCFQVGTDHSPTIRVEGNSCSGLRTCSNLGHQATGNIQINPDSCQGENACYYLGYNVATDVTIDGCDGTSSCDYWVHPYTNIFGQTPNCFTAYRSPTKSGSLHDDEAIFVAGFPDLNDSEIKHKTIENTDNTVIALFDLFEDAQDLDASCSINLLVG